MKAKLIITEESENTSFSQRWRGKFKPANKSDARYLALAKRYFASSIRVEEP
ncbi:MAG TPA: hypothetical protein VGS07_11790 [Thermoanaerobaculia bacterium]|jgi:hypothetical protein|nr:hypothetical protein [Thermoanaerobaculia bacterium]